jgi:hypothetical protein
VPGICVEVAVPAAANDVPHWPATHVARTHSFGGVGQSVGRVHPPPASISPELVELDVLEEVVPPPPAPLLLAETVTPPAPLLLDAIVIPPAPLPELALMPPVLEPDPPVFVAPVPPSDVPPPEPPPPVSVTLPPEPPAPPPAPVVLLLVE